MKNQRKNSKGKWQEQTSLFTATRKPSSSWASPTSDPSSSSSDALRITHHALRALPIPPEYSSNQKIKDEIELFGFEVILTRPINTETMSGKFSILEG